jgi:hypothetical protein
LSEFQLSCQNSSYLVTFPVIRRFPKVGAGIYEQFEKFESLDEVLWGILVPKLQESIKFFNARAKSHSVCYLFGG